MVNAPCPSFCPEARSWCCRAADATAAEECVDADYVNHSFAAGSAEDYFQCVAPTAVAVVVPPVGGPAVEGDGAATVAPAAALLSATSQEAGAVVVAVQQQQRRTRRWGLCHWFFWLARCRAGVRSRTDDAGAPYGSHPAMCNESSAFITLIDGLCYADCKAGWSIKLDEEGNTTTECQHDCHDPFGIEGLFGQPPATWSVCTNSTAALDAANWDILHVTKNSITAVQAAVEAIENRANGLDTSVLVHTIRAFGEFAVHFNRPSCKW